MLNRRTLALAALGLWCLLFVRTRTTEKSMVRAVVLEWDAQGWTAGLLYQAPEAAADSSEASAQVRFAAAQGGSLGQALSTAEGLLPQQADYRLCDHVLLAPGCTQGWLREYEQLVLERRCGRLTARILGCGFTCQELSQASEETEGLPEKLLQAAKQAVPSAGVLYQREEGLTVPLLALQQDGVHRAEGGLLLSPSGRTRLTEDQLQAALMIQKKGGERRFWANGQELCLRVAAVSLEQQKESFLLRMDCQPRAGGVEPDQEQAVQLEQLCQEVVQLYWTYGVDLAGLCPFARSPEPAGRCRYKKTSARRCRQMFVFYSGKAVQCAISKVTVIVVPTSTSLSSFMRALWIRAICLTMARPNPVPPVALLRLLSTR